MIHSQLRIAYRLAEFLMGLGDSNPLPNHEIYMYVLDAVPMLIALISLNLVHPGTVLVGPGSDYTQGKKDFKEHQKAIKHARKNGNFVDSDEEEGMMLAGHQELGSTHHHTAYRGSGGQGQYSPLQHERYDPHQPPQYQHDSNYV